MVLCSKKMGIYYAFIKKWRGFEITKRAEFSIWPPIQGPRGFVLELFRIANEVKKTRNIQVRMRDLITNIAKPIRMQYLIT